jgi:cytidylate kinase
MSRLRPEVIPRRPIVTIAALYGAGGNLIGPRVAGRLGVHFLDRAIPAAVAERAGVREDALSEVDDEPQSFNDRVAGIIGRAAPPLGASGQVERLDLQQRQLRAEIEDFLAEASWSGGVVLGRGGAVVLASIPGVLHVHLGGDRKARIQRVMELNGIDRAAASRRVKSNDRARRSYVESTYGIDGGNPSLYHLMIDAIELGVDVCVDLIVAASESRIRNPGDSGAG